MKFKNIMIIVGLALVAFQCSSKKQQAVDSKKIYESDQLIITRLSENAYMHTSFLQTNDFGNVPCNGLIVTNDHEAVVFDTPTNDSTSLELINWVKEKLGCKITAIIPTHFHNDCLAGLKTFSEKGIPSHAYYKTIDLAKANQYAVPENGFQDSLVFQIGKEQVITRFFGEGHTVDNVVGYFPSEQILFGGCLIKELDASKGYLGDANVDAWSATVEKVKRQYPEVKIVVPGHGEFGDSKLLDYTIKLFKK